MPDRPAELSEALIRFCRILGEDTDLQAVVMKARDPLEVVEISSSVGCSVSVQELRIWSRDLSASYFPWSGKGHESRRDFFKGF